MAAKPSAPPPLDAQAAGATPKPPAPKPLTLDEAFTALGTFAPGDDAAVLLPIEQAVQRVHGDRAARAALESRLAAYLKAGASEAARKFVCRELAVIGSAASVPALAALLPDAALSHMARYALERIPGPEADQALRGALATTKGPARIGVMHSLGARRDAGSVPTLARILSEDPASAAAAAKALGEIGTPEAAQALQNLRAGTDALRLARADALLAAAERLLAAGQRTQAAAILEPLAGTSEPPHVRLAARRALSAAARP